jgi:hypothetical protein
MKVRLAPRAGVNLRDPVTKRHLPPEGAEVTLSSYWRRRIADGDALPAEAPATGAAPSAPKTRRRRAESAETQVQQE